MYIFEQQIIKSCIVVWKTSLYLPDDTQVVATCEDDTEHKVPIPECLSKDNHDKEQQ